MNVKEANIVLTSNEIQVFQKAYDKALSIVLSANNEWWIEYIDKEDKIQYQIFHVEENDPFGVHSWDLCSGFIPLNCKKVLNIGLKKVTNYNSLWLEHVNGFIK